MRTRFVFFLGCLVALSLVATASGQSPTSGSPTPPTSAESKATAQVRQAEDSDLIIKEWHSPITFSLDASWLGKLPLDGTQRIQDLPVFYCDGATIDSMTITKTRSNPESIRLKIDFDLYVKESAHDKIVETEFSLMNGDAILPLGRDEDKVAEGRRRSTWVWYEKPEERFSPYLAAESHTQLRVSMIVRND